MGIQGRIGKTTPIEVISFLNSSQATGTLSLIGEDSIEVVFRGGSIEAFSSKKNGQCVYKQIAGLTGGSYFFTDHNQTPRFYGESTNIPTRSVIYFIAKNLDSKYIDPDLYDLDMEFEISRDFVINGISFDVNEWRIIAILSEKSDVSKISMILGISPIKVKKILFALEQIGIVKRVRKKTEPIIKKSFVGAIRSFLTNLVEKH